MFRADRAHSGAAYGRGRNARNVMDLGGVQHVALRRPETLKVGGGQWIVGSLDRFTIHCPLPTTHYFRRSPSCRSRRPERMKRAPRNVRQASSLSGMPAMGDSPSPRQAGSLSDMFGGELMESTRPFAPRLIVGVVALCLLSFVAQTDARQSSPSNFQDQYVQS